MLSLYPAPAITSVSSGLQYAQSVFPVGQFFTVAVFLVSLVILGSRTDMLKAFASSSFISAIVAMILFALGMVQDYFVYAGVILVMASVIALYFKPEYA